MEPCQPVSIEAYRTKLHRALSRTPNPRTQVIARPDTSAAEENSAVLNVARNEAAHKEASERLNQTAPHNSMIPRHDERVLPDDGVVGGDIGGSFAGPPLGARYAVNATTRDSHRTKEGKRRDPIEHHRRAWRWQRARCSRGCAGDVPRDGQCGHRCGGRPRP